MNTRRLLGRDPDSSHPKREEDFVMASEQLVKAFAGQSLSA
jgi:hypothetical protein